MRFTIVALFLGVAGGLILGNSETTDHIKEMLTKSFTAQAALAKENNQTLKCGPLARLVPAIREQQIDAEAAGETPDCN